MDSGLGSNGKFADTVLILWKLLAGGEGAGICKE